MSEGIVRANRAVWDLASQKHVRDYDELLEEARTGAVNNVRAEDPWASLATLSAGGSPAERARLPDRGYFNRTHVNDSYPSNGAVEWHWNLGEIVTAISEQDWA